jgi:serine/threonine protein kinase
MQQLMALKVPPPWALCSADKKRQHGREDRYKANMLDNILKECSLLARCQDRAIVETFGWGMVQLDSPGPEQQSHTAPAGGAACTSSSSSSSASQLSATLQLPGMLLEYAKNGTLAHQLRSCPPGTGLSPRAAKVYIQRVTRALVYLHEEHAMCHRDIKPDNCLLFEEAPILFRPRTPEDSLPQHKICVMKLADLGIAKVFQNRGAPCSSTQSYTPSYRAPEMQEGLAHDLRIDTFAVGLLLIHLRTALPPFLYLELTPGLSPEEKEARRGAEELAREDCPYRQVLTPGELEFASVCLERNVLKRPHLVHLEEHPYYHL